MAGGLGDPLAAMRGGLVVSVQAPPGSPLRDPAHMAAMARAAKAGGARAVRAEGARDVAAAGADVLALDATGRPRADGRGPGELIEQLKYELPLPLLADVDCYAAGIAAREAGAAAVATTLSGYTSGPPPAAPDLELVERLAAALDCPVLAEGRYASVDDVRRAFDAGAHAVVVGTAITDPVALTRRFAAAAASSEARRAPA